MRGLGPLTKVRVPASQRLAAMKVDVCRFDPRLWNRELIGTAAFNRESPRWISQVATMTMPNTNSFVPNDL
jgi:hypothetical protein